MTSSQHKQSKASRVTGGELPHAPGDRWLNPHRLPGTEKSRKLIVAVLDRLQHSEKRKRRRKTADLQLFEFTITALVSDLTCHYLSGVFGTGLIVPRSKNKLAGSALSTHSRYTPPIFTASFPKRLDALEQLHFIEQHKGKFAGMPGQSKATTIRAGVALKELIEKHGVSLGDFRLTEDEVIILKARRENFWQENIRRLEYNDTPETEQMRADVKAVNDWLAGADIRFCHDDYNKPVDDTQRRLYRYFAGNFKSGGRLFKGFWQNLPKEERHRLRIRGENVVELDFGQLNPTLAYSVAKAGQPPAGDAYALPGLDNRREDVKQLFNAMLFDTKERTKFPKGMGKSFGRKVKVGEVINAICQRHPKIASVFYRGVGYRLMFMESEIMMGLLRRLRELEIVALPIFDAVLVKASTAAAAKAIMIEVFRERTGLSVQVKQKSIQTASTAASLKAVSY